MEIVTELVHLRILIYCPQYPYHSNQLFRQNTWQKQHHYNAYKRTSSVLRKDDNSALKKKKITYGSLML